MHFIYAIKVSYGLKGLLLLDHNSAVFNNYEHINALLIKLTPFFLESIPGPENGNLTERING